MAKGSEDCFFPNVGVAVEVEESGYGMDPRWWLRRS
jgi:hypothetical protein